MSLSLRDCSLAPGSTFLGRYDIRRECGAGSFGRVYEARQRSTGQAVAIKILRFWESDSTLEVRNQRDRFRREMRLCAELSHPNIVRLVDSGETEDAILYAVFDYVRGSTLREVLAREGSLAWGEALHLMSQVLDALACAHELGIVHRDLKPENIMVSKTGARRNALVLDFGLGGFAGEAQAWSLPRLTATCELMGTPCYAAPEQLRGQPTTRSDMYSWGLILLECLTGELAVSGASAQETLLKQLGPEPVAIPASIRSRRLRQILQTVTAKELEKRDIAIPALMQALEALDDQHMRDTKVASVSATAPVPGERRQVTIVCCGLTVRPSDEAPVDLEELDQLLRAQHERYAQLAARSGGRVASTFGERLLIVFGYPAAREDDARRAAGVALRISADAGARAAELAIERGLQVETRVAVHTGLVIVHDLARSLDSELLDLVGITPQVATRLVEFAAPGEVLVSVDTHRLLRAHFVAERAGEHRLPELSRPLLVFRLIGTRTGSDDAVSPLATSEAPLVGRDQPLALLLDAWTSVQRGRGRTVLVTGEPGIGKSRVVREMRRRLGGEMFLTANCSIEARDTPLRPIAEMIVGLGRSLATLLEQHGLEPSAPAPVLAAALGLPLDRGARRPPLTPERERELALTLILRLLIRMAEERPLVLAVEDLQWADPTTLELITLLVHELAGAEAFENAPRVCLVGTGRLEFSAPWAPGEATVVQLQRLDRTQVEALIAAGLTAGQVLAPGVLDEVIRRADGIPLFVEEVMRVLAERGPRAGEAEALVGEAANFDVPGTLRDLLTARLDGLSSSARETAQLAAVLGREFTADLLRAASVKDDALVRDDLRELVDAGIVHHRRGVEAGRYVFKHALVRDAAYESMVRGVRQQLHRRVASVLRERFPETDTTRPEILAAHCERAGDIETAIDYWKRAGDRTMARGAYAESNRLFERGLALLERLPASRARMERELALTESLGTAVLATQGYAAPAVEEKFSHAMSLCEQLGRDAPIRVLHGIWSLHVSRANREAALALQEKVSRLAAGSTDPVVLLTAHAYAGHLAFHLGEFARARDESAMATRFYRTEGYRRFVEEYGYDGGLYPFAFRMWSLHLLGQADAALAVRDEMLSLAEESRNPYGLAIAWGFSANLAHDRGDTDAAVAWTEKAIAHATEQKLYLWLGPATCSHGWALARRGEFEPAFDEMQRGLQLFQLVGLRATYPYHLGFLVELNLARGQVDEGLAAVDEALTLCRTSLDAFYEGELLRLRGELFRLRGDDTAAEASLREGLAVVRGQRAAALELRAATSLSRLLRDRGAREEARTLLSDVGGRCTEGRELEDFRAAAELLKTL